MDNLDDGESACNILLEKFLHFLICPSYLPHQLDGPRKRKRAEVRDKCMRSLNQFYCHHDNKIDKTYDSKKVVAEITYGILKRASSKYEKAKDCNRLTCPVSKESSTDANSTKEGNKSSVGNVTNEASSGSCSQIVPSPSSTIVTTTTSQENSLTDQKFVGQILQILQILKLLNK